MLSFFLHESLYIHVSLAIFLESCGMEKLQAKNISRSEFLNYVPSFFQKSILSSTLICRAREFLKQSFNIPTPQSSLFLNSCSHDHFCIKIMLRNCMRYLEHCDFHWSPRTPKATNTVFEGFFFSTLGSFRESNNKREEMACNFLPSQTKSSKSRSCPFISYI